MYLVLHYTTEEGASVTPFNSYFNACLLFNKILHDIKNDYQLTNEECEQAQKEQKIHVANDSVEFLQLVETENEKTIYMYEQVKNKIIFKEK